MCLNLPQNILSSSGASSSQFHPVPLSFAFRMSAAVKAVKAAATNDVIVLDAGDQFTGTVWDVVYQGNQAPPFQRLLGVQAMTLGNHGGEHSLNIHLPPAHPPSGGSITPGLLASLDPWGPRGPASYSRAELHPLHRCCTRHLHSLPAASRGNLGCHVEHTHNPSTPCV